MSVKEKNPNSLRKGGVLCIVKCSPESLTAYSQAESTDTLPVSGSVFHDTYGNSRVCHSDWIEEAGHEQSLKGCSVLVSVPTASLLRKGTGFLVRKPLVTVEKSRKTLQ